MKISNSYLNNGLWDIFNTSSANPEEVAGGQNNPTKLASGDTVLISDEARQLLSEALQKYHNGELDQNYNANDDNLPGGNFAESMKIDAGSKSADNQSGGSGGSSGASDSESIKKQIEKLQSQLQGLIGQLGSNSADAGISAKIASLQSQIAELQAQLSA